MKLTFHFSFSKVIPHHNAVKLTRVYLYYYHLNIFFYIRKKLTPADDIASKENLVNTQYSISEICSYVAKVHWIIGNVVNLKQLKSNKAYSNN
jgi:hypothetical protein